MKNNKKKSPMMKIVSAAAMLAVSASMLGTSTYAWFSMNKTVKVASMSIAAKSADAIIEISANGTDFYNALSTESGGHWQLPATTITNGNETEAVKLKLVTPNAISTASGSEGSVSWGWASSNQHGDAEVNNTLTSKALVAQSSPAQTENNRAAYLGVANDGLYVLTQKLTIRNVSPDVIANNLVIDKVEIDKGSNTIANAVRVLFVAADGKYALYEPASSGTGFVEATQVGAAGHQWLSSSNSTIMTAASSGDPIITSALAARGTGETPASGSSTNVDVYVFFDGTDTDAYTDKATNLSDVSVRFEFKID